MNGTRRSWFGFSPAAMIWRHKYILLAAVLGTERVATIIVDMQVDFIANACRAA
ncbi:MAG TPA: hypothetical protein VNZ02_05425 [Steroidobacteraceae bacterium]|nr:hypothetical protein [Steroidobacteraceae bacterium]